MAAVVFSPPNSRALTKGGKEPHYDRECARRRRQIERGILRITK